VTLIEAVPSVVQNTLVVEVIVITKAAAGSEIVTPVLDVHRLASVMVTVYVVAVKPVAVAVV
jgi:limonene-1,2-epoxide hydrolase